MKNYFLITYFSLLSISSLCQEDKKLSFVLTAGANYNDINLGDYYLTDRIFSHAKSITTPNFGALINFQFAKTVSIEGGIYYAVQKVGVKKNNLLNETNYYLYEDKLHTVVTNYIYVGNIKATSIVAPINLLVDINPKKGKIKAKLVLGLLRQFNYIYKETHDFSTELVSIDGENPSKYSTTLNDYFFLRATELKKNIVLKPQNPNEKLNNYGFLIGLNFKFSKRLEIDFNKNFIEIRPQENQVFNFNLTKLNLRYKF